MIYVACPANIATGGTELLHQFYFELKRYTEQVRIFYTGENIDNPVNSRFLKYSPEWVQIFPDRYDNVLVFPEVFSHFSKRYSKAKMFCWWLSVDNYLIQRRARRSRIFRRFDHVISYLIKDDVFTNSRVEHLSQCAYISDFLKRNGCKSALLSDYINEQFVKECDLDIHPKKRDIVLYNPLKGMEFTQNLIKSSKGIEFVPLEGMSPSEVIKVLRESKVYIDFGNHPGKDRFPREAALMGCAIITGKRGSAGNEIDVPIPAAYKIQDKMENIPLIISLIERIFRNFALASNDFSDYRRLIMDERHVFEAEVQEFYKKHLTVLA